MNKNCRATKRVTSCEPTSIGNSTPRTCDPFNVCIGFGRMLSFDGQCLTVTGTPDIEDGVYNSFKIVDGCFVSATDDGVPQYTPAPCAPSTDGCGGGGGGGGDSSVNLDPQSCNLLGYTNGLLSAIIHFGDSEGVTVSGCGTPNDPIRFTVNAGGESSYVQSGSQQVITVEGTGEQTSPYTISLAASGIQPGTYAGFSVDMYGRITGYDESAESSFVDIQEGEGTEVSNTSGLYRVDLTDTGVTADNYTFGGYSVSVDKKGRIANITRNITLTAGTYKLGAYNVTVNSTGSITEITEDIAEATAIAGTFIAAYRGDSNSTDTDRQMTFTTELSGIFHVEYRGYIGATTLDPGVSLTIPSGYVLDIDGVTLSEPVVEVMGSFDKQDGAGKNAVMCIRGTTSKALSVGQHTVTITAPDATITQRDGFVRAELVEKGA